LQIWDTAGQERFKSIVRSYYRGADAIILVSDVTNHLSLMEIDDIWLREVRKEISEDCQICLFVNKADREEARLSREERRWCERYNMRYYLVSAKTGRNVAEAI
jgi:Ras-related protein Rab-18